MKHRSVAAVARRLRGKVSAAGILRRDPTRTRMLRQQMERTLAGRFDALKAAVLRWALTAGGDAPSDLGDRADSPPATTSNYQPFITANGLGYAAPHRLVELPDVRQPDHYSCGAAIAMSVGLYYGVGPKTLAEWKQLLGTDAEESTHPTAVIAAFRSFGCPVETFSHGDLGTLKTYTMGHGWPVVCPVQDYGPFVPAQARFDYGHYLGVIGVDLGYVFAQDPSASNVVAGGDQKALSDTGSIQRPGRVMVSQDDWLKVWHDKDVHGNPFVRYGIAVGPPLTAILRNAALHHFPVSADRVAKFKDWLRTRYTQAGLTDAQLWRKYIIAGYKKGAGRAWDDYKAKHAAAATHPAAWYQGGRDSFLKDSFAHPETVHKVRLLVSRTFDDVKNVNDHMATVLGRTLADGLVRGQNPRTVARQLAKDIDGIGRRRALLIARTELIRAHAEGQLDSFERIGVTDLGVLVEWTDSGKNTVSKQGQPLSPCARCLIMRGTVTRVKDAHGLIPFHPLCECAWVPTGPALGVEATPLPKADLDDLVSEALAANSNPEGCNQYTGPDCAASSPTATQEPQGEANVVISGTLAGRKELFETADKLFGVKDHEGIKRAVAAAVGATGPNSEGQTVRVYASRGSIRARVSGQGWSADREFHLGAHDARVCHNEYFRVGKTGHGVGVDVFTRQVEALRKAGFDRIETGAAGSKAESHYYNGYYTWAAFGYNARIPWDVTLPSKFASVKDLHELLSKPGGLEAWKEHGHGFEGVFDLKPGSKSLEVLAAYRKHKGLPAATTNAAAAPGVTSMADETDLNHGEEAAIAAAWAEVGGFTAVRNANPEGCNQYTGPGCSARPLPPDPTFISSDKNNVAANEAAVAAIKALAAKGDTEAVKNYPLTPSPKLKEWHKQVLAALGVAPKASFHEVKIGGKKAKVQKAKVPKAIVSPTADHGDALATSTAYAAKLSAAASSILTAGTAAKDAVLQVHAQDDPAGRAAAVAAISEGPAKERALHEYAHTPTGDLRVLSRITVKDTPVQGQAVCNMASRSLTMGSTSVTGDFRHELGHAVRSAWGNSAMTQAVKAEFKKAQDRVKADPPGHGMKLTHDEYESKYGVIGKRGLDNFEENAAEHYRGYQKAVYARLHEGDGGKALARYRQLHPGWARIWDAHYTAQLKGV
jgi:hypothetical protein